MITFDSLPSAVAALQSDMEMIKSLLQELPNASSIPQDEIFDVDGAAKFLGIEKPTLYEKVSKRMVPFMKESKKLYFSKQDLTQWLKSTRRKVRQEV